MIFFFVVFCFQRAGLWRSDEGEEEAHKFETGSSQNLHYAEVS